MTPWAIWRDLGSPERFSICLAAAMAVAVALLARRGRRIGPWAIAALAFLPVPPVALFSAKFNLVGWHVFMHTSPSYQVIEHLRLPPEDPLFAGGSMRYPWVEQVLVGLVSRFTGANVTVFSLCLEVLAWGAFLAGGAWLASALTRNRVTIALTTLLCGFGITVVHTGIFSDVTIRAFPRLVIETRCVPVDKFANITAMPIGYAALVWSMGAGLRLAAGAADARRMALVVGGCALIAAFFHPLSWLCLLAFQGAAGLVLLFQRSRNALIRAGWLTLAVLIPTAIAWPYLRQVGATESSEGWMGIMGFPPAAGSGKPFFWEHTWALFWSKVYDLLLFIMPLVVLAYVNRAELLLRLRQRDRTVATLLLACVVCGVAYILIRAPARNEYKFLLAMTPPGAAIIALTLRGLLERHLAAGVLALFLLLLPGGRALGYRPWFVSNEDVRLAGRYVRATDLVLDELYQFIAMQTPPDAVFIAPDLRVPPLGHRSLYIAVDAPWRGRDGWGVTRYDLLQQHVRRPDAVMYARQHRATVILNGDWARPPEHVIAEIRVDIGARPLFVHTPNPDVIRKLDTTPGFERRFQNAAGAVYEVSANLPPALRPR